MVFSPAPGEMEAGYKILRIGLKRMPHGTAQQDGQAMRRFFGGGAVADISARGFFQTEQAISSGVKSLLLSRYSTSFMAARHG